MKKISSAAKMTVHKPMKMINKEPKIKFVKMDARFTGYPQFRYMVEFFDLYRGERIRAFNEFRVWCIETWGPSIEREHYLFMQDPKFMDMIKLNPAWCWHTDDHKLNIYLRDNEEKVWAELRWK